MTDDVPTPSAPDAPSQEQLQDLVNDTRRKLDELVATQQAARKAVTIATIAILLIVFGFGTMAFMTLKTNLNRERLVAVAQDRAPGLLESAQRALMQTQERVLPAYQDEAIHRLGQLAPRMLEAAEVQVIDLPDGIRTDVERDLQTVLEHVRVAVVDKLVELFPYMSRDKVRDSLADVEGYAQLHGEALKARIEQLQIQEQQRVQAVLVKFPVPDNVDAIEKGELTKDLLKCALEYALWEVEVSGTDEGLDWAQIGDFSSWNIK